MSLISLAYIHTVLMDLLDWISFSDLPCFLHRVLLLCSCCLLPLFFLFSIFLFTFFFFWSSMCEKSKICMKVKLKNLVEVTKLTLLIIFRAPQNVKILKVFNSA